MATPSDGGGVSSDGTAKGDVSVLGKVHVAAISICRSVIDMVFVFVALLEYARSERIITLSR